MTTTKLSPEPEIELCDTAAVDPAKVARVNAARSDEETVQRLAATFAALADPTRLRIVEALSGEELCVCDLSSALGLTQSSTSHHLRVLRNLRLVRHRRAGKLVYYFLDDTHILRIVTQGLEHVREGR